MQKIVTFLWFNNQAEPAAKFYTSLFRNSKIVRKMRVTTSVAKVTGQRVGSVLLVEFTLEGQRFLAMNGGPHQTLSPAISLLVYCKTQAEIDRLWKKLSADPKAEACGWCRDKFGLSWQITPANIFSLTADPNATKADRAMAALMTMKKLDAAAIKTAHAGRAR